MGSGKTTYFNSIKKDIQTYFGKNIKISDRKPGKVKDLSNPTTQVLFFSIESKEELDQISLVVKHAEKAGTKITAYIFSNSYEKLDVITNKSFFYFDLNDFSLFAKKKGELLKRFENDHFELAISFLSKPNALCNNLLSDLNADFKVGLHFNDSERLYDLTIQAKTENLVFIDYYEQVFHYLTALNIKTN